MEDETLGLVLFADVVGSRRDAAGCAAWLRGLLPELDAAYGESRIAPFGFTQGDEIQGLLQVDADPLVAVLLVALSPGARRVRWATIRGSVDAGQGPATERTGEAFLEARDSIEQARREHERLLIRTGRDTTDELLSGMTPALMDLLEDLTPRQRVVARLALIDGLRQSEIAQRLDVRRATIAVSFGRARIRSLERLIEATRRVYSTAVASMQVPSRDHHSDLD
jgi:DNA-binding CsgD family transcriptional regulator